MHAMTLITRLHHLQQQNEVLLFLVFFFYHAHSEADEQQKDKLSQLSFVIFDPLQGAEEVINDFFPLVIQTEKCCPCEPWWLHLIS